MNWWVFNLRFHISTLIAVLSVAFVAGVAVTQYVVLDNFSGIAWLLTGFIAMTISFWNRRLYTIPLIIVGGCLIGFWRGSAHFDGLSQLKSLTGKSIVISGVVSEDVDTDTAGQSIIRLKELSIDYKNINGMIWVSTNTDAVIKRSDRVIIDGKLGAGFGNFGGVMYRARVVKIEHPQPGDVALIARDWFADAVQSAIPQPQASLGIGYLVGQKRALPADLVEALKIAGLTHVVVASGYNLTILVRLARRLFMNISKYAATLATSLLIASFVAITGLSPSMSRAGLVTSLSLAAWYYGRRFHPIVLLTFVAAMTVMMNPSYVAGDLGWQLSFAAFGGVMILAPLLQRYFFGDKQPGNVRQILGETVAALIVTAPILVGAFGQFSNVAIIANLLVLPLVPYAMLLTFIAGIGALVLPAVAWVVGLPATWLLGYMVGVAQWLSHLSWAVSNVQLSSFGVVLCYVIIIASCIYLQRVTKHNLREVSVVD